MVPADLFQALDEADDGYVLNLQPGPGVDLHNQRPEVFVDHQVHTGVAETRRLAARGRGVEDLFLVRHLNPRQDTPGVRVFGDLLSFEQSPSHLAGAEVHRHTKGALVEVSMPISSVRSWPIEV